MFVAPGLEAASPGKGMLDLMFGIMALGGGAFMAFLSKAVAYENISEFRQSVNLQITLGEVEKGFRSKVDEIIGNTTAKIQEIVTKPFM